jgi:hypothetical protein
MTTNLLTDAGHVRGDLKMMETAVSRSIKHPDIPIPPAVIDAMPKVVSKLLVTGDARVQLRAGELLLKFMEYNRSLNPPEQKQPQTTINVGVNVSTDERRNRTLSIARRFGAGGVLPDSATGAGAGDSGSDCIRVIPDTDGT